VLRKVKVWSVDVNHYQKIVPSNPPEPLHAPPLHNSAQTTEELTKNRTPRQAQQTTTI
jgi:hypothetical protein